MGKIRVQRKGYTRKGGVEVKSTSYFTKDMGMPGRTPKNRRFFQKKGGVKLGKGYTNLPAVRRHARLRRLERKHNITRRELWNELRGLGNVHTGRKAKSVFVKDADYVMKDIMKKKDRINMTRKARKTWMGYSHKRRQMLRRGGPR